MKALARFGKAFGGYKMIDVPQPICGPEDVVIEIKAAAICGADMKHYNVDSGSDEFNSIRAMSSQVVLRRLVKKSKTGKWGNASCRITAVTSAAFVRPVNKVIFCVVQKSKPWSG